MSSCDPDSPKFGSYALKLWHTAALSSQSIANKLNFQRSLKLSKIYHGGFKHKINIPTTFRATVGAPNLNRFGFWMVDGVQIVVLTISLPRPFNIKKS